MVYLCVYAAGSERFLRVVPCSLEFILLPTSGSSVLMPDTGGRRIMRCLKSHVHGGTDFDSYVQKCSDVALSASLSTFATYRIHSQFNLKYNRSKSC